MLHFLFNILPIFYRLNTHKLMGGLWESLGFAKVFGVGTLRPHAEHPDKS